MLTSCGSDDDSTNPSLTTAYFTINRNEQSLREDFIGVSNVFQDCLDPDFRLTAKWSGRYIETSEFSFNLGVMAPSVKLDIDNNLDVPITTDITEESLGTLDCGLIYQFLPGYYEFNRSVKLDNTADNINTIVDISMISESETKATYAIRGNYSLTYTDRDGQGYNIKINGEYVIHVETLK
jgi:hypothetical protein